MFDKVMKAFREKVTEHNLLCRIDPYYAHCYGSGKVPAPCCQYCIHFEDPYCMKDVNNNDLTNVLYKEEIERNYDDLCEDYEWDGEWEDE